MSFISDNIQIVDESGQLRKYIYSNSANENNRDDSAKLREVLEKFDLELLIQKFEGKIKLSLF